ncbi:phosphatase PAP2 family protein [Bacillus sp. V5-8f]|uniref:phosphatase PAP2 family protein n=1 Tax=Bacillus sp. V5-8f TaxID=2053044 RepID=UPI000C769D9A|nr:phosphatase PAP2 family protein [Bacillus sp. V5-8f]PLT34521.1 phosphatase PAP2 family protein [Bacillus sp. V5-8f]
MNKKTNYILMINLASLLGFCAIALLVSRHAIVPFDESIISFIQGFESPMLTVIMNGFTFIGGTVPIIVIFLLASLFLFIVWKHRSELLLFFAVLAGSTVLFMLIKRFIQRERPDIHRLIEATGFSFPSGNATMAMALYGFLLFIFLRHISSQIGRIFVVIFCVGMILFIGISRVYMGVHYPSDILAGYLVSTFWLTACIAIYHRYQKKRSRQEQVDLPSAG